MNYPNAFDKIARLQEEELPIQQPSVERTKQELLQQLDQRQRGGPGHLKWIALAAAILTAAGIFAFLSLSSPAPKVPSNLDLPSQWLMTSAKKSESMGFADGSRIVLSPRSAARVIQIAPHSVRVLVENGQAHVRVTHAKKTSWLLEAGPYTVHVTGTQFTILWDASAAHFGLNLEKGSVVVTGPMLEDGKRIRSGERIAAWVKDKRIEISGDETVSLSANLKHNDTTKNVEPGRIKVPKPALVSPSPSKSKRRGHPVARPKKLDEPKVKPYSWMQLCDRGEFRQVVVQAQHRGLHEVNQNGLLRDLMALGEAARLTRKTIIAIDAYRAVRTRFTQSPERSNAAFYLGKMAFDQRHAYGSAATWLDTYLKEAPGGAFAKGALGKLIEAQTKSGDSKEARKNATLYLHRYPQGPHAGIANSVIGEN